MKLSTPCIVVNFKGYSEALGPKAVTLARQCENVAKKTQARIAVCVSAFDVYRVSSKVNIPVFGQHLDPVVEGAHTGWALGSYLKAAGGVGSLLNHSEMPVSHSYLKATLAVMKQQKLQSLVCSPTAAASRKVSLFRPDFVGVEPPALIGGDVSVSSSRPSLIKDAVKAVGKRGKLLVGAGIKNAEDVAVARRLGAHGVLVASGVVKAKNPFKSLSDLVHGLKNY